MCGIAGIIGLQNQLQAKTSIQLMTNSLKHRGPDAVGSYVADGVALGHLRLSIIDLSEDANQPFFDPTKRFSIIFNGEIYNYREIKNQLKDYHFQTDSDTEVILAAYLKFGKDCLSYFNGMFAFAIWDNLNQELFVARDRLGVKPFFYSVLPTGVFIFASEIRALLNCELLPRKLDNNSVYNYLMFQTVYSPQTIVKNINQLEAGFFGIFSQGKLTKHQYWCLENQADEVLLEDRLEVQKTVKELLLKSVERRLISDVSLGAFLSGGIDSSAIVALMSEISDQPVNTFSITFEEKEFDESKYSNLIACQYRTNHTKILLKADDFLKELPHALKAMDSPTGDGLNTFVVSKATKKAGITVALSGVGGDELFAGYPNFLNFYKIKTGVLSLVPPFIAKPLAHFMSASSNTRSQRIGALLKNDNINVSNFYTSTRQVISEQNAAELFPYPNYEILISKNLNQKLSAIEKLPLLSQFTIAEMYGYTQNVLLKDIDQFSMASALEVREPFFDYQLIEYVLRIPDKIKYPRFPKSLLVDSLYPLLPDEIVHRPKMGFVLPWSHWMRFELKDFCSSRIKNLAQREIFDPAKLLTKWDDFQNGKRGVLWSHLWHLIVLTDWLENNKF